MGLIKKYGRQYSETLFLAAPVVMSQIGQVVVQLIDNAMVGRLGALPLAAVSFGGTIFFMVFILCVGLSMGLTPMVGQAYARGDHYLTGKYLLNSIALYIVAALFAFGLQMAIVPFMYHMGQPEEVVAMAIPYYKYIVWSIIPFMLFAVYKQFLEGVGNTVVAMVIVIGANIINIIFNYLLIYGKLGFPEMGAAGAGLATFISRVTMAVSIIVYFSLKDNFKRYYRFFTLKNLKIKNVLSLLAVGAPISLQMFMEGSAFALCSIMMGWIGTVEIAANQIATVISNFAFMMVVGLSAATTIRISHEYGRGEYKELKLAANASYHVSLLWNTITALIFISLRNYLPRIFTDDPQVIQMASYLLLFVAAFQFSDGLQAISIGILRGLKDVKSVMVIAFFSYLVVNIPIAYLCAFVFKFGAGGLWLGFIFGLTTAAVLLGLRFRSTYRKIVSGTYTA